MATTQETVQISAVIPTLTVDDLQSAFEVSDPSGFLLTIFSETSA